MEKKNKFWIWLILTVVSLAMLSGCCLGLNNELMLRISYAKWYTTTEEIGDLTFGYVYLNLSGSTTGEKVIVITYGDGVIGEIELDLDQDKRFAEEVIIQFTHDADDIPREYSTILTAYKGNHTTSISLESGELTYLK